MDESENKTASVSNWRDKFRNRPVPMLGLAFGGGVLLAAVISKRKNSSRRVVSHTAYHAADLWDNARTAIIGAAAAAKLVRTLKRTWNTRSAW